MTLLRAVDVLSGKVSFPKSASEIQSDSDKRQRNLEEMESIGDAVERFPILPPRIRRR